MFSLTTNKNTPPQATKKLCVIVGREVIVPLIINNNQGLKLTKVAVVISLLHAFLVYLCMCV